MICQFKCRDDIKKDVVNSLNNTCFFQKGERRPLIVVGWLLGCCILSEALNIIKAQNEMAELSNEPDAKVEIDKVILLSPAWYINDIQGLLSSFLCNQKYETKESEKLNKQSSMWAISYIIRNPKVLYYLFNIAKNADNKSYIINTEETGIDILKNYDSLVVLPSNDGCIDVEKTKEKCQKAGIPVLSIGNYGHMSFLVSDVKDLILEKIEETSERKLK